LRQRTWRQSQLKLHELYKHAIDNFDSVPFKKLPPNQKNNSTKEDSMASLRPQTIELNFSSAKLQKWIIACEHLNGLKMVLELREWMAALHIGFRAFKAAPFDYYVWLELFKILIKQARKIGR
jgi:hypothetical protein